MIDPATEELIKFQKASRRIPGNPHISTLYRWHLRGVRGTKLESVLVGNTRFTSLEAIARFIFALNASEPHIPSFTEKQREQQSASARRELEEMGI